MNKRLISRFLFIFIIFYSLTILTAFIFIKTGFVNYKNLYTLYWTDEKDFYYALDNSKPIFLASSNGKVKAAGENPFQTFMSNFQGFVDKGKFYAGCVSNIQGTVNCMTVGATDTASQALIGGTASSCKEAFASGNLTSDECNTDGAVFNKLITDNSNPNKFGVSGGLMGMINVANAELGRQSADITNINYYAAGALNDIPFVGNKVAKAATIDPPKFWAGYVDSVALGKAFYSLWVLVRNFTYVLIIIPTVVLGFAVMFKMQIGPQTQVTLLSIIPKLLIVLLLITFSYPLSALIVKAAVPLVDILIPLFSTIINSQGPAMGWNALILFVVIAAATYFTGGIFGILLFVILILGAVIAAIKYLVAVFTILVKIGFLVAFSPLIFLVSAFPGKDDLIKQYFLNLSAYVLGLSSLSIMYMAAILVARISANFADNPAEMFLWLGLVIVSIGIIWKSPDAPKMIGGIIGAKPIFDMSGGDQKRR